MKLAKRITTAAALAVRSAAPGASRCISRAVAVCSPFRCRAAGAGTDPGATVPAGNVPAWHGLRWRCSIRAVFAVCRRGQILHLTGLRSRCRALT